MPSRLETRVNTHTAGSQDSAVLTTLTDGGWVITWTSFQQDGSFAGVFAQAYNPDGTPRGSEFQVNTFTASNQYDQRIAALADGGWIITWQSQDQDGDGWGIFAQAYNADGTPQGGEVQVNSFFIGDQEISSVTALGSGGWVIIWNSDGQDGDDAGVYAQAFNADGTLLGTETRVNSYTADSQYALDATALADGGWVITWQSRGQDGDNNGMYLQAYNADGTPRGSETQVNGYTPDGQNSGQVIALADGGWVVAWQSDGQDGDNYGILFRAYDADGTIRGPEMQVNSYTTGAQLSPRLTQLDDGGWVVMWTSYGQDGTSGSEAGVFAQVFNADGTTRGGEIQVNTHEPGNQLARNVTSLAGGGWVATWESDGQDGSGPGVYVQVFAADGSRIGAEVQVNTYTASFQDYPQTTALPDGGFVVAWRSYNQDGEFSGIYSRAFAPLDPDTITVTLTGTQEVGETLTAEIAGINPDDNTLDISYIWTVDGVVVAAGANPNFTLTAAHANSVVAVAVHIDDSLFPDPAIENAPPTGPIDDGNNDPTGSVLISSSNANPNRFLAGDTASADDSAIADADGLGTFSYQWLRSGVEIAGATAADYVITSADEGHRLTLVISYTDGAGFDEVIEADWIKIAGWTGIEHYGDRDDESIFGTDQRDRLEGRGGNDLIFGGDGKDLLAGGNGDDLLSGGRMRDKLVGGAGNDTLLGGHGPDTFVFRANDGDDLIEDFQDGSDIIKINSGASGFGDLTITQVGDDVHIAFSGTTITLADMLMANITDADFQF